MLICDIKKSVGHFSLNINFTARPGVTALMGASGSGKSMALRCIAGVSRPDEGHIELNGTVLFDSQKKINLPPQRRNTGFLFQDSALFPNMTVRENIMTGAKGKPRRERQTAAKELAAAFHIFPHLDKYPHELSGGEKQRAALARILAGSPNILMLDEPFSALDSHLRWELELELAAVFERFAKPALYVSHNRDEVYRLCDNIVILNEGRSERCGSKREVFQNPQTVQAARLTGCKNIAAANVCGQRIIVKDWGIDIDMREPMPNIHHIGIRANCIVPAAAAGKSETAAAFPFEIVSEIEDTFTSILMIRKRGTNLPPIRWEMPKKEREVLRGLPQEAAFLRGQVLFLE